jgi:cysteine-rich repeat protein
MRGAIWLLITAAAGCLRSETVVCNDFVCPQGTVCDDVHGLCIDREQRTACAGMADGVACTTEKRAGICDQSVCLPGCSDGVQDSGEECDDGNRASHDGCSAACVIEVPTWTQWQSPWTPRSGHMVAYDSYRMRIVVFGGSDEAGATDDLWERDTDGGWQPLDITRPPPRSSGAMAYDPVRKVTVLFGGASKMGTFLRDTWEYDGTTWRQIMPPASPSARVGSAMVFDPVRSRIMLVHGLDSATGLVADVWQYDGVTWTQITTTGLAPSPRRAHAVAWDTARQRLVMFGGIKPLLQTTAATGETWELAFGTSWTWTCISGESSPCPIIPTRPSVRYSAAMTYSTDLSAIVMFGGLTAFGGATSNASDTWLYTATGWAAQTPSVAPAGRNSSALVECDVKNDAEVLVRRAVLIAGSTDVGASDEVWELGGLLQPWQRTLTPGHAPARSDVQLVYDAKHDRTLTVAGYYPPQPRRDVFAFDAKAWRRIDPLPLPLRFHTSATYDSTHERVVVFGGMTYSSNRLDDTDVLMGASWTQVPGPAPSPRFGAALAHDARTGANVLFGGNDMSGAPLRETWELVGTTWSQNASAGGPPAQSGAAMAFDPVRQELVLLDIAGKTWLYTNRAWRPLDTKASPSARFGARLVFSRERNRVVLFGGVADSGTTSEVLTDMWELDVEGDERVWHQVLYSNPPPPRRGFGLAAHDSLDSLVLRAGFTSSGETIGDTWLFQYK